MSSTGSMYMDLQTKAQHTGHRIGFSSSLRRYGASLANHQNYDRNEFLLTLANCHQNLGIEGLAKSPAKEYNEDGEEIESNDAKIEWQTLQCPKCLRNAEDSKSLLEHLVESHGKAQDKFWYKQFNTIGIDIKKMLDNAIRTQEENSYIKKKFRNSNDLLVCPIDSPLAPFLMMRHLQITFQEMSQAISEGISLKIAASSYTIIFSFHRVEKARRRIKRAAMKKSLDKRLKILENQCVRTWVPDNDIVFKRTRTPSENKALVDALGLPPTCSHEDIVKKINAMKVKHDEMNSIYSNNVKPNGEVMSTEEKRLISSLTNDMVVPISGKRKTTYKNPSELAPSRKRRATSSPGSQQSSTPPN